MTNKLLWSNKSSNTLIDDFLKKISKFTSTNNYNKIHEWSIQHKDQFWDAIWDFTKIIGNKKGAVLKNSDDFINSVFFENCELNFTENNLLKMLNPILNSSSIWKSHALHLMAEYFFSKNEKQKSKQFFEQILNLENSNPKIKLSAQQRIQRDFSE